MVETSVITFASAECFTHSLIGAEVHRLSAPYVPGRLPVSVVASLFLPGVFAVRELLGVSLPSPICEVNGVKVYDEEGNVNVVRALSRVLKEKLKVDIALSSSAGIGRGVIAVLFKDSEFLIKTEISLSNFPDAPYELIEKRKREGVEKAVDCLKTFLEGRDPPDFVEVVNG